MQREQLIMRFSIRNKLISIITLLIGLISLFIFIYFPSRFEKQAFKAITDNAESISEMTALSISSAVVFGDNDAAQETLKGTKQNKDLLYIIVVNDSGHVFAAVNEDSARKVHYIQNSSQQTLSPNGIMYKTKTPIYNEKNQIGMLYMGFSLEKLRIETNHSRITIALVSFMIFVIGMILVFIISTIITKPLGEMIETVEQISQGDLTKRTNVSSGDEVGHLAQSFNLMVDTVEERTKQLQLEIIERKQAEQSLRESEERFRSLVTTAPDTILLFDSNGKIVETNKAYAQLSGYTREEMLGRHFLEFVTGKENQIKAQQLFWKLLKDGSASPQEIIITTKSGQPAEVEVAVATIKNENNAVKNFIAIIRDITERKRLEEQLSRSQKFEFLGKLLGGVAHDLNNILVGMVTYPDAILMKLPADDPLRRHVLMIKKSGQKAAEIVFDLLTIARGGVINKEKLNLNDVVSDYVTSPEFEKLKTNHPSVNYVTNLLSSLSSISGSKTQLSKALMNLVTNAAEALPDKGNIVISSKKHCLMNQLTGYEDIPAGEYVMLSVSDTGIGISSRDMKKIFEPFYTNKPMGTSGTGLGLSVVWTTMKDHDGYIDVMSTVKVGTTFNLYFPVCT